MVVINPKLVGISSAFHLHLSPLPALGSTEIVNVHTLAGTLISENPPPSPLASLADRKTKKLGILV